MAQSSGVEHSIHIPARGGGKDEVAPPERRLNCFIRSLALIERLGNALGTLAFTWATVVLLGGYPAELGHGDYWIATTIFFLEAARMFSRDNRTDYQLFFGTRGALKPLGWNGLILIVYFNGAVGMIARKFLFAALQLLPLLGILVAVGQFVCPGAPRLLARIPLRRVISLWSPMVALILLGPSVLLGDRLFDYDHHRYSDDELVMMKQVAKWMVYIYAVLLVVVLLVTVSRTRFPSALCGKQEFWSRVILNLCMVGAIVVASFLLGDNDPYLAPVMIVIEASTVVIVSFGNLQIPAAIVRVVLPLIRLGSISQDYKANCSTDHSGAPPSPSPAPAGSCNPDIVNLAPTLFIFYGMVLGQGALYVVACVLDIFSFIPRRYLVHRGGFKGQWGVDSVNLYYAYALEKCLERNVLAPKISLCSFAIDSLNSDSAKRQLHGIRVTHILLLQRDPTRTRLLVKLTASAETMTRLMRMLEWTGQGHQAISRLFAVKVIDELAKGLLVATVPGIVQNVSLLLDCGNQKKRGNPLLDTDDEQEQQNDVSIHAIIGNQMERGDAVPDTRNLPETQDRSTQQVSSSEQNCWIARWWRHCFEFWSIPQEGQLTEQDLLPVLGMSIIESLATYDQSNCEEISKEAGLIRKIARFTSFCTSDTKYTDAEKKVLVHSSLNLLHRLTSIDGEIGITLRQKISKHPFLLRDLSEILGDITSCHEPRKLAAGILRNLAVDASMRQKIGHVQMIITRLMHAFLTPDGPSSTDGDRLLRKVAGQALALLAMDNVNNCLAMLRETRYELIKELTSMIYWGRYSCVAASLLRSMCLHARPELKETHLKELSDISQEVLERILRAEGAELEIFVGLSSHIYKAIPEAFAREFEYSQIMETFVKRLVDALNANMEPSNDCPGIRRVILEQAINLMEYDSRNVNCFIDRRMIEVVSVVEETMSDAENYNFFLGDVGLMEAGEPLSSLVARAKQLLGAR